MKPLIIYTDGACSGNQHEENIGGWGAILEFGEHSKELFGGERNTTNNRMEMQALLSALQAIKKPGQKIRVFSDSSYLMNCFREQWYLKWYQNNWKTAKRTDVENRDLWEALFEQIKHHQIEFFRVKGHVNLKSKATNLPALYAKFLEWNGPDFTMEEFLEVTNKNNRADELANLGIKEIQQSG